MKIHPSLKMTLPACVLAATLTTALPFAQAAEYNYTADNVYDSARDGILWLDSDANGNTVTVTGVTAPEVDLRASYAPGDTTVTNNNTVTITNSALKAVAGAHNTGSSPVATATNNVVSLSGSTVKADYVEPDYGSDEVISYVYGARTVEGDATQNHVTISNSTVEGELAGAKAEGRGNSMGNSLTITDGTTVSPNHESSTAYGGYTYSGNAESNSVTFEGASTLNGHIYGGYTDGGGNAMGNTVTIREGAKADSYCSVNGGYISNGGEVTNNSVTITNASVGKVFGGRAEGDGTASGNSVEIRTDATETTQSWASSVAGGDSFNGNVGKNSVTIENARVNGTVEGGFSFYGNAMGNTVTIRNNASTGPVRGGYSNNGNVSGNTVMVESGSNASSVYGGYSSGGTATDNHVTIKDATFGSYVYGGRAGAGDEASGNTVTLNKASSTSQSGSTIYGGYTSGNGNATDNTVTLMGEANELSKSTIYGGYSSNSGDAVTGNTLTLDGFKGTVKGIRNFDTVNFVLNSWEEGATLLTLTDEESLLNNFTLNIDFATWNAEVEAEGQMTLIAGLSSESLLANWTFSVGGVSPLSADTPFEVQLVTREDGLMDLVAVAAGNDTVPEPTTATLSLLALAGLAARRRRK